MRHCTRRVFSAYVEQNGKIHKPVVNQGVISKSPVQAEVPCFIHLLYFHRELGFLITNQIFCYNRKIWVEKSGAKKID